MVTRRALLSGAAALGASLAAPALSGCGGDTNALTFFFQAAPAEARVRRQIIEAFGRLHPEIEIRVQLSGPDPQQQILTYCAGGRCPDILMQWESYSRFAALGVLQDLNVMLDKDPA
ncbi:extracellular solute-binding protein [Nocardia brasiliensis]|nr:extracellular solute-binding protein [Nocardia brasiliensis]